MKNIKKVTFPFKDGSKEIKVGEFVYLPADRNVAGRDFKIMLLGRKYITIDNHCGTKFSIIDGREVTNFGTNRRLFSSKEAYEKYLEDFKYTGGLRRALTDIYMHNASGVFTKEKVLQVAEILGISNIVEREAT